MIIKLVTNLINTKMSSNKCIKCDGYGDKKSYLVLCEKCEGRTIDTLHRVQEIIKVFLMTGCERITFEKVDKEFCKLTCYSGDNTYNESVTMKMKEVNIKARQQ